MAVSGMRLALRMCLIGKVYKIRNSLGLNLHAV
jgi:hypothetical protein